MLYANSKSGISKFQSFLKSLMKAWIIVLMTQCVFLTFPLLCEWRGQIKVCLISNKWIKLAINSFANSLPLSVIIFKGIECKQTYLKSNDADVLASGWGICQNSGVNWFHVVQINLFLFIHHCAPLLCEYPWWTFVRLYRLFWFYMYSCLSHLSSSHSVLTLNSSCFLNIFMPSYLSILYNLYVN